MLFFRTNRKNDYCCIDFSVNVKLLSVEEEKWKINQNWPPTETIFQYRFHIYIACISSFMLHQKIVYNFSYHALWFKSLNNMRIILIFTSLLTSSYFPPKKGNGALGNDFPMPHFQSTYLNLKIETASKYSL